MLQILYREFCQIIGKTYTYTISIAQNIGIKKSEMIIEGTVNSDPSTFHQRWYGGEGKTLANCALALQNKQEHVLSVPHLQAFSFASQSKQSSNFSTHLFEIKNRVQYVLFSIVCAFIISYIKSFQLVYIFLLSFISFQSSEKSFIFTDIHEAFSITITLCLFYTLIVCLPLICYQLFCFFLPSWYNYEGKNRNKLAITILLFWYLYVSSLHLYFIPELCSFFLQFQINTACLIIKLEARILSYVSWTIQLLFVFTLFFVFVIVLMWFIKTHLVKVKLLIEKRKYFLWTSFLFAAIISPPEFVFQVGIACLIFVFSEIFLLICFLYDSFKKMKNLVLTNNLI
jgi:sec-independent protein translocase protein TatC